MITFQNETLAELERDATPLFEKHWQELALAKDRTPLAYSSERYAAMEQAGNLHLATVRDNDKLAGYYYGLIVVHPHYALNPPMAFSDAYFVLKEYRKGNTGMRFVDFIERSAKARGADRIFFTHKVHLNLSSFFEFMGYEHTDQFHAKLL